MVNHKLSKVLLSFLKRKPFKERLVTYNFKDVTWDPYGYYLVQVDAILPQPNSCFYVPDLKTSVINHISETASKVLDKKIGVLINLTINGKSLYPEIFINKEKQDKIITTINSKYSKMRVDRLEVDLMHSYRDKRFEPKLGNDGINFLFDTKLYDLKYEDIPVKIKPEYFDSVFTWLYVKFLDSLGMHLDIADTCYQILEDQQMFEADSYIDASVNFVSLDGKKFGTFLEDSEVTPTNIKSMIYPKNGSKF